MRIRSSSRKGRGDQKLRYRPFRKEHLRCNGVSVCGHHCPARSSWLVSSSCTRSEHSSQMITIFLFFLCVWMQVYVCECSGYNLNMRMRELFLFMSVNKRRQGFAYPPLWLARTLHWHSPSVRKLIREDSHQLCVKGTRLTLSIGTFLL